MVRPTASIEIFQRQDLERAAPKIQAGETVFGADQFLPSDGNGQRCRLVLLRAAARH